MSEDGTSELYNMINSNNNNLNNVDLPFTMANIIVNENPKYGGNYKLRINPLNDFSNFGISLEERMGGFIKAKLMGLIQVV